MSRLRVAILGPGGIAARHAGAIAALRDEMELVAAFGRDADRTAAFTAKHGGVPFTDPDAMFDRAQPDLLIAALPPHVRDGAIEQAAECGIHLLVEKPIALDVDTGRSLVAAAETAGVTAACAFMYRFGDAVAAWRARDAGAVHMMTASYHCNALHAPWWRTRALSGGQLLEQAIHLIDLVRVFMGEPDSIAAHAARRGHRDVPGYDSEDVSAVIFGWDDGRVATLAASNVAVPGRWQKGWSLFAERASAAFTGWNDAMLTRTAGEVRDETIAGITDVFVAQLADVAAAIREGRPPRVPLSEGQATLELALAARRAADERRMLRRGDDY
jgi:predicted dehydrogenase